MSCGQLHRRGFPYVLIVILPSGVSKEDRRSPNPKIVYGIFSFSDFCLGTFIQPEECGNENEKIVLQQVS